jgi:hypothetical protein
MRIIPRTRWGKAIAVMVAVAMIVLAAGCGSPPDPRDVGACKAVRQDVSATRLNPADYVYYQMAEAIAVSPDLRNAIKALGQAIVLRPLAAVGYGGENEAIKLAAALCAKEYGVSGIGE